MMEITGQNKIKLPLTERIYEIISIIKPTHKTEPFTFLEGPIWIVRKTHYNDKLVNRVYHTPNHHIYAVHKMDGPTDRVSYWLVSGRGNINEISYERAFALVNERVGYIEDSDMELGVETDPAIPYQVNQDT